MTQATPKPGDTIAVWFSCGAASAIAAKLTLEKYSECDVRIVNNPVAEEDEDNQRFCDDVAEWLGVKIEQAINPDYPSCSAVDVWAKRRYMGGIAGAPCTLELKKKARQHWEAENRPDWHVLGFTAEEKDRHERFVMTERENVIPVLIEEGITKQQCIYKLLASNIEPPRIYKMGYPNANCIGCVKASSPTYWNHVRKTHPDVFEHRAKQSKDIGAKLVRVEGERIALHDLDPDAKGAPLESMSFECGLFCEEGDW